jgi:hypothetical protein
MDDIELLHIWRQLNDAFNRGEPEAWRAFLADSFTAMASGTYMEGPDAFVTAALNGRAAGWVGQHMISVSARNNLLTTHYYNVFADGSRTEGAGVALFDDDGKIVAVRALNNSGATPMKPDAG